MHGSPSARLRGSGRTTRSSTMPRSLAPSRCRRIQDQARQHAVRLHQSRPGLPDPRLGSRGRRWHSCQLHRPGPVNTAIHATCSDDLEATYADVASPATHAVPEEVARRSLFSHLAVVVLERMSSTRRRPGPRARADAPDRPCTTVPHVAPACQAHVTPGSARCRLHRPTQPHRGQHVCKALLNAARQEARIKPPQRVVRMNPRS